MENNKISTRDSGIVGSRTLNMFLLSHTLDVEDYWPTENNSFEYDLYEDTRNSLWINSRNMSCSK